jgi:hypothetical protein
MMDMTHTETLSFRVQMMMIQIIIVLLFGSVKVFSLDDGQSDDLDFFFYFYCVGPEDLNPFV